MIVAARFTAAHLMTMECRRRSMRNGQGEDSRIALRARAALLPAAADRFLLVLEQPKGPLPDARRLLTLQADFSPVCDPMSGEDAPLADADNLPPADPIRRMPPQSAGIQVAAPEPGSQRTGPLRHGNPRRDLQTLPCCGARTRAAMACRQPAMRNGRCRFHGGKSTGARTEPGRAVLAAKATRHGFHGQEGTRFLTRIRRLLLAADLLHQAMAQVGQGLEAIEQALSEREPIPLTPPKSPAGSARQPAIPLRPGSWHRIPPFGRMRATASRGPPGSRPSPH